MLIERRMRLEYEISISGREICDMLIAKLQETEDFTSESIEKFEQTFFENVWHEDHTEIIEF